MLGRCTDRQLAMQLAKGMQQLSREQVTYDEVAGEGLQETFILGFVKGDDLGKLELPRLTTKILLLVDVPEMTFQLVCGLRGEHDLADGDVVDLPLQTWAADVAPKGVVGHMTIRSRTAVKPVPHRRPAGNRHALDVSSKNDGHVLTWAAALTTHGDR